ncbi:MAG: hypothetical protein MJE68_13970 [Proteobacteria bacterium]|nr:hypothetical protein [Pseudomonadota bacterium]
MSSRINSKTEYPTENDPPSKSMTRLTREIHWLVANWHTKRCYRLRHRHLRIPSKDTNLSKSYVYKPLQNSRLPTQDPTVA